MTKNTTKNRSICIRRILLGFAKKKKKRKEGVVHSLLDPKDNTQEAKFPAKENELAVTKNRITMVVLKYSQTCI